MRAFGCVHTRRGCALALSLAHYTPHDTLLTLRAYVPAAAAAAARRRARARSLGALVEGLLLVGRGLAARLRLLGLDSEPARRKRVCEGASERASEWAIKR